MSRVTFKRLKTRRTFFGLTACTFCVCLGLLVAALESRGYSQELGGMPRLAIPEKTPNVLTPGIRQDAIIMRSGMGESFLVPKTKYEEFENFLNARRAKDALERLELDVEIDQLTARMKVNVLANFPEANVDWIGVPIALGTLQPVPKSSPDGAATEFPALRVSTDSSGYIWRVAPGSSGIRELHFDAISKVRSLQQGNSLRLDLPPVQTIIRFELPKGKWELNLAGNGSEIADPFQDKGSKSVSVVRSSGGSLTITWSKKEFAEKVQSIEVESITKYVPMVEAGDFRAVSNLTIRGPKTLGGRRFLITLPPKSQWREPMTTALAFPGYRLGRTETSDGNTDTVLLLEFEEAFSRTELELSIEWQTTSNVESNRMAFSMLRVEGVQRHEGSIEVAVPRNVSFRWEPQSSIQFSKQSQSNDGSDFLIYSFRIQQQHEVLRVEWSVGDRASDLKALYSVEVDPTHVRFNGSIDFLGDVRSLPFLQLEVRGWSVDRVQLQPSGRDLDLIAIRSLSTIDSGALQNTSIPLSLGELLDAMPAKSGGVGAVRPAEGGVAGVDAVALSQLGRDEIARQPTRSISFVLSQPMGTSLPAKEPESEFGFSLPMLSWLDPESQQRQFLSIGGELSLRSTTARLEQTKELSESFTSFVQPTTGNRDSTLTYRLKKSRSWLEWNGRFEPFGAVIDANAITRVLISTEYVDTIQTWKLSQTSGRMNSLRIAVPKHWIPETGPQSQPVDDSESVRCSVDEIPVKMKPVSRLSDVEKIPFVSASLENRYAWMQIDLPPPRRNAEFAGVRELTISKKSPHASPLSVVPVSFDWLLPWMSEASPDDTLTVHNYAGDVVLAEGARCVLQSPIGEMDDPKGANDGTKESLLFDRTQLEPRLIGKMSLSPRQDEKGVEVESVWLQTIVNAIEQRDRFVVRFKTQSSVLSLKLPAVRLANSEFIVNGRRVVPLRSDINHVELPLDAATLDQHSSTDHIQVLEAFVWSENKSQWLKTLRAEPLTILNSTSRSPFAWQIVVPSTVHVIGNTSTLSPGYHWKWQDLWYGRKSEWNQDTLASFMGATTQPFVSQQTNQYVFFSLDHTIPMGVSTAPRSLLWAPVALFVLFGSFAAMEFRWIRRPWLLIVLLLLGLAFSQWAWDLSVALVQCLTIALGIAAMYALLKWSVDRRARRRSVFASRPSSPLIQTAGRSNSPSNAALVVKSGAAALLVAPKAVESEPNHSTTYSAEGGGRQ